jgi:hypothetical protein
MIFQKKYISQKDLNSGVIFKSYDLISGDFTGCMLLLLDGDCLIKTSIDSVGVEKLEKLIRDETGNSVLKIYNQEIYKLKKDPLIRQRRIRYLNKRKR